jgi:hypothetical protein
MQQRLGQLREDYGDLKGQAVGALGFLGIKKEAGSSSNGNSSRATGSSATSSSDSDSSSSAGAVATNLVYAGLKFSGLAARVAGDLGRSLKADAEKMMKDMEAEAEAKVGGREGRGGVGCRCVATVLGTIGLLDMIQVWGACHLQKAAPKGGGRGPVVWGVGWVQHSWASRTVCWTVSWVYQVCGVGRGAVEEQVAAAGLPCPAWQQ